MNYIILDLEWNASYSRKISAYVNEIIEFGAVKCDENLNIINTFSSLVRLSVGKKLSSIVSELTKIKKEELDSSQPFMQVASKFRRWAGEDCVILTWGLSDVQALIENFRYFSGNEKISFMHKYADMQVIAQDALDMNVNGEQLGLDAAADMLNLDVSEYKHHRALGDSLITLEVFKNIIDKTDVLKYTEIADEEFYKKMTFKTVFLSDIDNPIVKEEIDKPVFCSKCGKPAHRTSKWLSKSRKLMANFICKSEVASS